MNGGYLSNGCGGQRGGPFLMVVGSKEGPKIAREADELAELCGGQTKRSVWDDPFGGDRVAQAAMVMRDGQMGNFGTQAPKTLSGSFSATKGFSLEPHGLPWLGQQREQ
eukprot:CAMPEP_0174385014 /NCGR_PEP_ID=MMETSP0811_2-20130205/126309_1 /TAXON_ID=73025 ORGANISM="Eutreptiella gymnastica-like, Strain CCMP1594" /NCGR_SAMPLE_ID=MMETSP0811_2 /ASSEMBLY_ACC=CAM_ASM_000667 /LENGTH=108 /DNA_ID=CAMNT_0015539171 /DNA_START=748 /DNA_END=1075 /DNA_ORIENTATION=+